MKMWPQKFLEEIRRILGEETEEFLLAMETDAHAALRINPARENAYRAAEPFFTEEKASVPWEECGFYADKRKRPGASIAHAQGAFYMQDASAMAPAAILNPKPCERVLDLCAAPGGKSGQIAGKMRGEGFLLANEIEPSRAKILLGNLERLGVSNAAITSAAPAALAVKLPGFFDAVLVDAPCSGEGMFRRDENSVLEWAEGAPAGCAERQKEVLDEAAKMVRPGGRMVYSTCTFNRLENEGSIESFLERHPDFRTEDFFLPGVGHSKNGMIRLWPHKIRGEGHFAALLRRTDGEETKRSALTEGEPKEAKMLLSDIAKALPAGSIQRIQDELVLISALAPDVRALSGAGVRVLRAGLPLASVLKNRIEPHHALAMAMKAGDAHRAIGLNAEEAERFMAGEVVQADATKGWALMMHEGMPLGWGKASDGNVKNHLPKGLRRRRG